MTSTFSGGVKGIPSLVSIITQIIVFVNQNLAHRRIYREKTYGVLYIGDIFYKIPKTPHDYGERTIFARAMTKTKKSSKEKTMLSKIACRLLVMGLALALILGLPSTELAAGGSGRNGGGVLLPNTEGHLLYAVHDLAVPQLSKEGWFTTVNAEGNLYTQSDPPAYYGVEGHETDLATFGRGQAYNLGSSWGLLRITSGVGHSNGLALAKELAGTAATEDQVRQAMKAVIDALPDFLDLLRRLRRRRLPPLDQGVALVEGGIRLGAAPRSRKKAGALPRAPATLCRTKTRRTL